MYEWLGFLYPVFGAGLVLILICLVYIVARDRFKDN
jgi:hypothetical protein